MIARMTPTGEVTSFADISIGEPFAYAGSFWVRTSHKGGTDLRRGPGSYGSCAFYNDEADAENNWKAGWLMVERVETSFEE